MKTILSFVVFICLISTFSSSASKAQCPTTIHPTVGEAHYKPWRYDSLTVQDSFDVSCRYKIYYCERFLDSFPCNPPPPPNDSFSCTTIQRFIDTVILLRDTVLTNPSPCGGTVSMISKATDDIWHLQYDTVLPPCGAISVPTLEMYSSACWMLHDYRPPVAPSTTEKWVFTPCSSGNGVMCIMRCKLCQDGDDIMRFDCSYTITGTPECKTLSYDPRTLNMPIECFRVQCGEHP